MTLPFSKYSGAGNDFILIDNRKKVFDSEWTARLCDRHEGIGADGILLLETAAKADAYMRLFNCDGTLGEMCGNGLRCFVKFLRECGIDKKQYLIETDAGLHTAQIIGDVVEINLPPPSKIQWDLSLDVDGKTHTVHFLNTGVPHAVLFFDSLKKVEKLGPAICHHSAFQPHGTNATFVSLEERRVCTYERGVERVTQACGTGAVAAALALAQKYQAPSPLALEVPSGKTLCVRFDASYSSVTLQGPADKIFQGVFPLIPSRY